MSFIDKALGSNLRGDEFLQAMSGIYSEPEARDMLDKYPEFVKDVIRVIDYDTTLQMEGLSGVISAGAKAEMNDLISALRRCGAVIEAEALLVLKIYCTELRWLKKPQPRVAVLIASRSIFSSSRLSSYIVVCWSRREACSVFLRCKPLSSFCPLAQPS